MKKHYASILAVSLIVLLSACSQSSEDAANPSDSETVSENKTDASATDGENVQTVNQQEPSAEASKETTQEEEEPVTKVKGKQTYIKKLDNIQKELDAMPEKKDSDKGVTNAMKSYYGVSYEKYDDALNEIYSLLKEKLSPEVMAELKSEQVKWIEEKEAKAEKERLKYEGGTFENVAWYISLYESTKDRCYELVEEYMTE
ncbi:lysozyme inhibitor LprI family protein [Rossellomorea vietnamensis]|uniref:lysozyme inhibitor LprI family protein n=1 Tax=Rossellomorea vietnamensis TaxID=218284 RepID=UPI001E57FA4A|nr:lysozyme inhibitor LprI family protein [Rossellomorea vietnamensis]MCC5800772.1 DUF1311 domain-containing protein [Rossellomorea vietnamensis]